LEKRKTRSQQQSKRKFQCLLVKMSDLNRLRTERRSMMTVPMIPVRSRNIKSLSFNPRQRKRLKKPNPLQMKLKYNQKTS